MILPYEEEELKAKVRKIPLDRLENQIVHLASPDENEDFESVIHMIQKDISNSIRYLLEVRDYIDRL